MNINVKINGIDYKFDQDYTIIQACEMQKIEIPRFCYHKRLAIAGNCRMCLVEVVGAPKPVASCACNISNNMVINTNNENVKKMREGVMEFLLINHPLDCPVCDQGGECDLQDQAMKYGRGYSSFHEDKRIIEEKNFGPLIKTNMTRCIQCMRCVRFIRDVAGVNELGAINRGENLEIINAVNGAMKSELSGNIIDLCPVGALTSRPYAFKARPWELKHVHSIDVMDGVGSHIQIDVRGIEVMRILPRENDEINEEWISDKTRFAYDGLMKQRLMDPYYRENGKLIKVSWERALKIAANALKTASSGKMAAIAGQMADCESMILLKDLMHHLGCFNVDCREDSSYLPAMDRGLYIFNTGIAGIDKADFCLIIGSNIRYDAPIINARIRRNILENNLKIALVGPEYDLTYTYDYLGDEIQILKAIWEGTHLICEELSNAQNPMIILGQDLFVIKEMAEYALYYGSQIAAKYKMGFNILHNVANRVGGFEVGFMPSENGLSIHQMREADNEFDLVYLLNADEIDMKEIKAKFVIYQGHHADNNALKADLILPGLAYTEKSSLYVNTEGRVQYTTKAVDFPGNAQKDWKILELIGDELNFDLDLNYNDIVSKLKQKSKAFNSIGNLVPVENWKPYNVKPSQDLEMKIIENKKKSFYQTNSIARNSKIMMDCMKKNTI